MEACRVALENPASPDAKGMLEALELTVPAIVYFPVEKDDDFESECRPTGNHRHPNSFIAPATQRVVRPY